MILGQTRNYILGIAGMLIISVWSPNKLAYTEPPTQCCDVIDNSLVFNSTILKLSAEYDSSEKSITTKAALVDSQSRVINKTLKKLNDNKDVVGNGGISIIDSAYGLTTEELQKLIHQYYYNNWHSQH